MRPPLERPPGRRNAANAPAITLRLQSRALVLALHQLMHAATEPTVTFAEPAALTSAPTGSAVAVETLAAAPAVHTEMPEVVMWPQHARQLGEALLLVVIEAHVERCTGISDALKRGAALGHEIGPALEPVKRMLGVARIDTDTQIGKVSIVGAGMRSHPGVAAKVFATLADENINIEMITTSPIKISCVIDRDRVERAVQALHSAFELGGDDTVGVDDPFG